MTQNLLSQIRIGHKIRLAPHHIRLWYRKMANMSLINQFTNKYHMNGSKELHLNCKRKMSFLKAQPKRPIFAVESSGQLSTGYDCYTKCVHLLWSRFSFKCHLLWCKTTNSKTLCIMMYLRAHEFMMCVSFSLGQSE